MVIEQSDYLNKLHKELLDILDYVVSVCEENHITYFLGYGTALGAYRHHGFIPWDDDMDIVIPRDQYERLNKILRGRKDALYYIQDEINEEAYGLPFYKVRKKNTYFAEGYISDLYQHNGIFIDVFPLDYIDSIDSLAFKWKKARLKYMYHCLLFLSYQKLYQKKYSKKRMLIEKAITFPVSFYNQRTLLNQVNYLMKSMGKKETGKYVEDFAGSNEIFSADVFFPPRKILFEGKEYNVPNHVEEYLTGIYDEFYMTLPPVEDRTTHMPSKIRFSDGTEMDFEENC